MEIFDELYLKHKDKWNFYTKENSTIKTFCLKIKTKKYSICLYNLKPNYNIYSLRTHSNYDKLFTEALSVTLQHHKKFLEKTLFVEIKLASETYVVDPFFPLNAVPQDSELELKLNRNKIKFYSIFTDLSIETVIKVILKKNLISLVPLYQDLEVEKSLCSEALSLEKDFKLFSGKLKPLELLYEIYREFGTLNIVFTVSKIIVNPPKAPDRFFTDRSIETGYEKEITARSNEEDFIKLKQMFPKPSVPICPICLQSIVEIILINCGHGICKGCVLAQALKNCNVCRTKIISMHVIYL
ncbi:hypothetical protein KM759_gp148 [Lymphocystis disease virus 4]|uniref:RING-type domain-containing protein n=1 Tax=Lymphocystis disease virus 4 TaxID=2704413 RepID=A0A6B9XMW3_9VIRU|nr:hypothetical protein KM759_gp148 [Lymphocystis disease virus 4]QHR78488.1 hypothetical protein [Lymphocystis disease virus 4]